MSIRLPERSAAAESSERPARRGVLIGAGALIGFVLSVSWSAPFVDDVVAGGVMDAVPGADAAGTSAIGMVAFAFVTGLAGSITACNVAALSAIGPMLGGGASRTERIRATLRPLAGLTVGMLVVSAPYGALVGLVGTGMPQFSEEPNVAGVLQGRLVQAMVVYGIIGLILLWLGLAAAKIVPDPLARVAARFPDAPVVFMGMLVGGFLIGRPFPLFRELFRSAAERPDPFLGAAAFCLQSLGNVLVLGVLFVLLSLLLGGRAGRWLAGRPDRVAAVSVVALIAAGTFLVLYWDVRLLAIREIIPWYPLAPWV